MWDLPLICIDLDFHLGMLVTMNIPGLYDRAIGRLVARKGHGKDSITNDIIQISPTIDTK